MDRGVDGRSGGPAHRRCGLHAQRCDRSHRRWNKSSPSPWVPTRSLRCQPKQNLRVATYLSATSAPTTRQWLIRPNSHASYPSSPGMRAHAPAPTRTASQRECVFGPAGERRGRPARAGRCRRVRWRVQAAVGVCVGGCRRPLEQDRAGVEVACQDATRRVPQDQQSSAPPRPEPVRQAPP